MAVNPEIKFGDSQIVAIVKQMLLEAQVGARMLRHLEAAAAAVLTCCGCCCSPGGRPGHGPHGWLPLPGWASAAV